MDENSLETLMNSKYIEKGFEQTQCKSIEILNINPVTKIIKNSMNYKLLEAFLKHLPYVKKLVSRYPESLRALIEVDFFRDSKIFQNLSKITTFIIDGKPREKEIKLDLHQKQAEIFYKNMNSNDFVLITVQNMKLLLNSCEFSCNFFIC